ncbi:hypothetical protein K439DRAFT_1616065 [Ramaria rubella]|nr:hypothetical protein K439DRAFT_1616065 [Ramaria rubella]
MALAMRAVAPRLSTWRKISTSAERPSSEQTVYHESSLLKAADRERRDGQNFQQVMHPRMIFVRPWDGVSSMAHAFAIVRAIERRFGRIQEFVLVRDSDVLSSASPFIHVTFAKAEDADAIPLEGKVIQVPAPKVDINRDGGVGLDDLHTFLDPEIRERDITLKDQSAETEQQWGPDENQVIDVKLERTAAREPPVVLKDPFVPSRKTRYPSLWTNPKRAEELGQAITAFGGFAERPSDMQGGRTSMDVVLARWRRTLRRPLPTNQPEPQQIVSAKKTANSTSASQSQEPWPSPEILEELSSTTPPLPSSTTVSSASPVMPDLYPMVDNRSVRSLPTMSLPPRFASSSLPPRPSPFNHPSPSPKAISEPKLPVLRPTPAFPPQAESKMPKRQRMLLAARSAGAKSAGRAGDSGTSITGSAENVESAGEPAYNPSLSEEDNKIAARKWWNFLTRGS